MLWHCMQQQVLFSVARGCLLHLLTQLYTAHAGAKAASQVYAVHCLQHHMYFVVHWRGRLCSLL